MGWQHVHGGKAVFGILQHGTFLSTAEMDNYKFGYVCVEIHD